MDPEVEDFNRRGGPISRPKGSQPVPGSKPRASPTQFYIPLNIVFYLCLTSHVLAALYAPIQDCDETFNYWEPLHYLVHGYGLQTWEYSPEFSIRSWAYILLHALPTKLASLFSRDKTFEFYLLRVFLGLVCAATEVRLFSVISRLLNPRIAIFYLMVVVFTPGFFFSSTAFLPSTFAMYTTSLGMTAFMDWHGGTKTASGIMWFGIGALLGWPFSGALIIPFVLEELFLAVLGGQPFQTFRRFLDGIVRCLIVMVLQLGIDSFFYRKFVIVPLYLVIYNVFSGDDRGPDIFGTEPWDYYIRNLLLNFNIWFVLALAAGPLLVLQVLFGSQQAMKLSLMRSVALLMPFYLWLAIFTAQAHKEERFMYPAYPFLALNAAIGFHIFLMWIGTSNQRSILAKIPAKLKLGTVSLFVLLALNVGLLRIVGNVTAYRAPLRIYDSLNTTNTTQSSENVCFGKDWYRFPTSFFLPGRMHAKFIKSEFDGLLPGEFHEGRTGFGLFPGAWLTPSGMNDLNQEDPSKYVDINHCTYLVDTYMSGTKATKHEPLYVHKDEWQELHCIPFLDTTRTSTIARLAWTPDLSLVSDRFRRHWGNHCLLRRKTGR